MEFSYDPESYNVDSAEEIVPIIMEWINPKSVIDVGCGTGTWLSVFRKLGVQSVLGIDGSHVDKNLLHISSQEFLEHDLIEPIHFDRKFDLVISLEVAEHIPEESAEIFVDTLISLGDYILFSAAIPHQGGDGHLNEQWPSYWNKKFRERGFTLHDYIRPLVWNNEKVKPWYKQNIFLAVHHKCAFEKKNIPPIIDIVHGEYYVSRAYEHELFSRNLQKINSGDITTRHVLSILRNYLLRRLSLLVKA